MASRDHIAVSERQGGQWRTVARVTCRKCGVSATAGSCKSGGLLPHNIITQKLEERGWIIGQNAQWDVCPACAIKEKDKPPVLKIVGPPAVIEAPREMGREDRRIIFEKLNEVYLDETRGYESGWSDHRLATDLGVPRKWVSTVRDEMFGAIGTNAEMHEFLTQAEKLLAEARQSLDAARTAREEVEKILKNPAFLSLSYLSDRMGKVERLASEVRKLVVSP